MLGGLSEPQLVGEVFKGLVVLLLAHLLILLNNGDYYADKYAECCCD